MEEDKIETKNLVINSNIILSSVVNREGITRNSLLLLTVSNFVKTYSPDTILREIKNHSEEISRKAGIDVKNFRLAIDAAINGIEIISEKDFIPFLEKAESLVNDEKDAPFVAVALKFKPSLIVTYNKKHFKQKELHEIGIGLATPVEALEVAKLNMSYKSKIKKKRGMNLIKSKLTALFKQ